MGDTINTVLNNATTFNTSDDARGPDRHAYNELLQLKSNDIALASPYAKASHVATIPAHTDTINSGNFTITLNFPNYNVAVTTGNMSYDANQATIQSAVDTALSGETVVASYNSGDVDVSLTGNLTANDATLTANGSTVNGAYMKVSTANVDLSADNLATPVVATAGTMDRAAEALLFQYDVVRPTGDLPYQGQVANENDYETGDNPWSLSPGLINVLVDEIIMNENDIIGLAVFESAKMVQ
jgi:hypothetical protein